MEDARIRRTFWRVDHPALPAEIIMQVRTWECRGVRVDTPEEVFIGSDAVKEIAWASDDHPDIEHLLPDVEGFADLLANGAARELHLPAAI